MDKYKDCSILCELKNRLISDRIYRNDSLISIYKLATGYRLSVAYEKISRITPRRRAQVSEIQSIPKLLYDANVTPQLLYLIPLQHPRHFPCALPRYFIPQSITTHNLNAALTHKKRIAPAYHRAPFVYGAFVFPVKNALSCITAPQEPSDHYYFLPIGQARIDVRLRNLIPLHSSAFDYSPYVMRENRYSIGRARDVRGYSYSEILPAAPAAAHAFEA
jgi:hypothetical protein